MSDSNRNIPDSSKGPTTYAVTIRFASPGARPPVYLAGSFTAEPANFREAAQTLPKWQPHELEYSIVEQDITASDSLPSYIFHRTFDLSPGTYQYKFRFGHEVTDALGNQNNRLVVAPVPTRPEALDRAAADDTSYSKNTTGSAAQISAALSAPNGFTDLSSQDERSDGPSSILDEDRTVTLSDPGESLHRRKQISVDSSDSSSNKKSTPPAARRSIVQFFFQCLQSIWNLLFGRKIG
ncbi:MAG: hypothetical protein Q9221_000270 [Calogaya cf. arnoldii]